MCIDRMVRGWFGNQVAGDLEHEDEPVAEVVELG